MKCNPTPYYEILPDAAGRPTYHGYYGDHELHMSWVPLRPFEPRQTGEARRNNRLIEAARAELLDAGEATDLDIAQAVTAALDAEAARAAAAPLSFVHRRTLPQVTGSMFQAWGNDIAERYGFPSRLQMASQFLKAWHFFRIAAEVVATATPENGRPDNSHLLYKMDEAACCFAEAAYFWRWELTGQHARARQGRKMSEGRPLGPATRKAKADERCAIVVRQVIDVIDDASVAVSFIAGRRKSINAALEAAGNQIFRTDSALRKELWRIRKDRRKDKLANLS
jgi:hypothetical protein